MYRTGGSATYTNSPSGVNCSYANILVIRGGWSDTQTMIIFPYTDNVIWFRSGADSTFPTNSWSKLALDAKFDNYLPLTGGTLTNDARIKKSGSTDVDFYVQNDNRELSFGLGSDGKGGIYDHTYKKWILWSDKSGSGTNIPGTLTVDNLKVGSNLVATASSQTHTMGVYAFEQTYGTGSAPCDYGMVIIHGYSRPNSWVSDTYYFIVNHEGASYNGWQINGSTSITWEKNINASNFSLSGTTLTITT